MTSRSDLRRGYHLPAWAKRQHARFEALLAFITQQPAGFSLIPVELSQVELGGELANWLESRGLRVRCFLPMSHDDWMNLGAELEPARTRRVDAVVVAGDIVPGFDEAVRALDGRRRDIEQAVARPLLWCGKPSFLSRTSEQAPGFWAAAAATRWLPRVHATGAMPTVEVEERRGATSSTCLYELLETALRRGHVIKVVGLGSCLIDDLAEDGRAGAALDLGARLLAWLDDHRRAYPEVESSIARHRPALELVLADIRARAERDEHRETPPPAASETAQRQRGQPDCPTCGGSGECLTCAGSGTWYAGSADEDACSSCGGTGRCPDCWRRY